MSRKKKAARCNKKKYIETRLGSSKEKDPTFRFRCRGRASEIEEDRVEEHGRRRTESFLRNQKHHIFGNSVKRSDFWIPQKEGF